MVNGVAVLASRKPHLVADQQSLRRHNLSLALRELVASGPVSRADLARQTGLTKATISRFVDALLASGVAEHAPLLPGDRGELKALGRPGTPVAIGPAAPVAIGLEIGVDFTSACLVSLSGTVLARASSKRGNRLGKPTANLAKAVTLAFSLVDKAGPGIGRLAGLGVALPGVVDSNGRVRSAPNMPAWNGVCVGDELRTHLGAFGAGAMTALSPALPSPAQPSPGASSCAGPMSRQANVLADHFVLEVGNEANLAALGELWYGEHGELSDFILISAEVGIGSGIVVEKQLFTGGGGGAGEVGHLTVEPAGVPCGCGSRGCLEQYAGLDALLRAAGQADLVGLVRSAEAAEIETIEALKRAGTALGIAGAALVNIVDVQTILIGGVYTRLFPYLERSFASELQARAVRHLWDPVCLRVSALGGDAAMRGAAGAVLARVLGDPVTHLPEVLASSVFA